MENSNKRIAIITKNNTAKLKDVGDINARALSNKLISLGYTVHLVYLNADKKPSVYEYSFWRALLNRYDVVYASSPRRYFGLLCLVFSLLHLKRLYVSIFDATLEPLSSLPLSKKLFKAMVMLNLLHPLAVSEFQKKIYKRLFDISPPVLLPCLTTFGYNKKYPRKNPPIIMFAGSIDNDERGIEDILKALNIVKITFPKVKLVILNKFHRPLRRNEVTYELIKKYKLENNTVEKGFVRNMSQVYSRAWVYVLPFNRTKYIPPLPFTMIEAMSFGVPVITTNKRTFQELIPKNNLINPGDYTRLARLIKKLIKTKAHSELPEVYAPENVASNFITLIKLLK